MGGGAGTRRERKEALGVDGKLRMARRVGVQDELSRSVRLRTRWETRTAAVNTSATSQPSAAESAAADGGHGATAGHAGRYEADKRALARNGHGRARESALPHKTATRLGTEKHVEAEGEVIEEIVPNRVLPSSAGGVDQHRVVRVRAPLRRAQDGPRVLRAAAERQGVPVTAAAVGGAAGEETLAQDGGDRCLLSRASGRAGRSAAQMARTIGHRRRARCFPPGAERATSRRGERGGFGGGGKKRRAGSARLAGEQEGGGGALCAPVAAAAYERERVRGESGGLERVRWGAAPGGVGRGYDEAGHGGG